MNTPSRTVVAAATTLLIAACATAPEAPAPPPFELASDHFVGTVRTGRVVGALPETTVSPLTVRLRETLVDEQPGPGSPVQANLVFAAAGGETLQTHSSAASGLLHLEQATELADPRWSAEALEALLPGTTLTVRTLGNATGADPKVMTPGATGREAFELQLALAAGEPPRVEVALVFGGEHLILTQTPGVDEPPLTLFVPTPTEATPRAGLVLELSLSSPAPTAQDNATLEAIARAHANVTGSRRQALDGSRDLTSAESFRFGSESALLALEDARLRRPALVFLARETGAVFAGELALTVGEETLGEYLTAVRAHLGDDLLASEAEAIGWFLDSTAYAWVAQVSEDPELELAPEVQALLLVHTGQVGRYPDLVHEVAHASTGLDEFGQRLFVENRIFLEDAHPAARVRALEWLRARGAAPAGFDPLAPRAERRAALAADSAASEVED